MPKKKVQNSKLKIQNYSSKFKSFQLSRRKIALILLIIGLALLIYHKKGWFIAATINGAPISNYELLAKLNKQYRTQTLNQMINEKILEQEAAKKGIVITRQQIDQKIAKVENQYGGKDTFNNLLSQQGLTRNEFVNQTRLQLIVEQLYSSEASPSAEEIQKFMNDNKDLPEATEPAKLRQTAEQTLRQQKLSNTFNEKFQKLRQSTRINIF